MLTTKDAIEKRRSIRKFKSDPVPRETILKLIDAARLDLLVVMHSPGDLK